jgi:putative ABC transport system ATP-binding protein
MIQLNNITKIFNQGKPNEFSGIRGISMAIAQREVTVLKGPSGSGKTTLLSMIGCLSRPTSGRILLDGRSLSSLPERFMTEVRRGTFGFVFQQFNLIKGITVLENITLPAYPLGRRWQELHASAFELLDQFGIREKADARVEWLSGGEAQRVAICRALINNPQVLIADEPTANLDTHLSEELMRIVGHLKAQGRTVILTSHDPIVFDSHFVDRRIEMRDGWVTGGA